MLDHQPASGVEEDGKKLSNPVNSVNDKMEVMGNGDTSNDALQEKSAADNRESSGQMAKQQVSLNDDAPSLRFPQPWLCCVMPSWWSRSFILDYIGIIVVLALLGVSEFVDWQHKQTFMLNDISISNSLHGDTINMFEVLAINAFPGVIIIAVYWYKRRDGGEDFHAYVLAIVSSLVLCNLTMSLIKKASGRPRPDFIARCAPECALNMTWTCAPDVDLYDASCDETEQVLANGQLCCPVQCGIEDKRYPEILECSYTRYGQDQSFAIGGILTTCNHLWDVPLTPERADCRGFKGDSSYDEFSIDEGFKSMPSGHIMNVIAPYTVIWFYLAGKTQVYGYGVQQRLYCLPLVIMSFGVLIAVYVGATRFFDFKHFLFDIVVGFLIGVCISIVVYPVYYQDFRLGGEPLRRPQVDGIWDLALCRTKALQKPWPVRHDYLPVAEREALGINENDFSTV